MIKNIFLPEKIGSYYLFAKRIVGLDIGKTHVRATQIRATGSTVTVEQCLQEQIEQSTVTTSTERIAQSISVLLSKCDTFDELRVALPSNVVVFKELRLPFTNHEKIKMVVNFEVEPLLPFSIQDAVIDFIITKVNEQDGSAEVLVAAVQKKHVISYLSFFEKSGVTPNIISIDLFQLYGLYKQVPQYADTKGSIALIDFGFQVTRIAHIDDGQLRFIRSLPQGVFDIAKNAGELSDGTTPELIEHIVRFGFEKTGQQKYIEATAQAMTNFWQNVSFTLNSFAARSSENQSINKILLLGGGANIKGLLPFAFGITGIECNLFDVSSMIQNKAIIVKKGVRIEHDMLMSFSTAFPSVLMEDFTLLKDDLADSDATLLIKQMITASVLVGIILGALSLYTFFEIRKASYELHDSEQEAIEELKSHFKKIEQEKPENLEDAVELAESEIKQQEETWFAFSSQARATFLKYLLELTNRIDKEKLGFVIESIAIADGVMTLKARVTDEEALKVLDSELRKSDLFTLGLPLLTPEFTMKIALAPKSKEK